MNLFGVFRRNQTKVSLALGVVLIVGILFYAFTARAATRTWDGGGGDNNWSTCANWSSDTCPTSADLALFDGTSDKDATIDGSFVGSVLGLQITSNYDGIITQSRSLTIGNNSFSQAGGTFEQGTQVFDINDGSFTISGGTFNSGAATSTIERNLTLSGGTYSHNSRVVQFDGGISDVSTLTCTGTFGGTVSVAKTSSQSGAGFTLASGCTADFSNTISTVGFITINGTGNFGTTLDINDGSLTLGAASTLTFDSSTPTVTIEHNFTKTSGATFNASGMTFTMDGGIGDVSTFTCTGTFGGTVNVSKSTAQSGAGFTLASGCTTDFSSSVSTVSFVIINGTANFGSVLDINDGSLTLGASSTLTFSSGSPTITIERDFTKTAGATFSASGMTLTFDGGISRPTVFTCSGTFDGTVNIAKTSTQSSTSFTLASGCEVDFANTISTLGQITINGTGNFGSVLDINDGSLILGTASTLTFSSGSPTITIERDFTKPSGANFNASGMIFTFDGGVSRPSTFTCSGTFDGAVNIAKTSSQSSTSFTIASGCSITSAQNISTSAPVVVNGTFALVGYNLSATSVTVASGGTLRLYGGQTITAPTLSTGSTVEYYGPSTYTSLIAGSNYHHLAFTAGTYNLTGTYTVAGNFTNTGATYNQTSGTITFNGTANTLSGNNTFNNLTKSVSATSTLTFGAGSTQTINGTLTLSGTGAGSRLVLQSSSPNTQYSIAPEGTRTLNYLAITDANNTSGTDIICYGSVDCTDGGNNTAFLFEAPPPPDPKVQLNGEVRFGGVRFQ